MLWQDQISFDSQSRVNISKNKKVFTLFANQKENYISKEESLFTIMPEIVKDVEIASRVSVVAAMAIISSQAHFALR